MDGLMQELVERASAYVRAVNSQRNDELMLVVAWLDDTIEFSLHHGAMQYYRAVQVPTGTDGWWVGQYLDDFQNWVQLQLMLADLAVAKKGD